MLTLSPLPGVILLKVKILSLPFAPTESEIITIDVPSPDNELLESENHDKVPAAVAFADNGPPVTVIEDPDTAKTKLLKAKILPAGIELWLSIGDEG